MSRLPSKKTHSSGVNPSAFPDFMLDNFLGKSFLCGMTRKSDQAKFLPEEATLLRNIQQKLQTVEESPKGLMLLKGLIAIIGAKLTPWSCSLWENRPGADKVEMTYQRLKTEQAVVNERLDSFLSAELIPGTLYGAVYRSWFYVRQQPCYARLLPYLTQLIQAGDAYNARSGKLKLIQMVEIRIAAVKDKKVSISDYEAIWDELHERDYDGSPIRAILSGSIDESTKLALMGSMTDHFLHVLKKEFVISRDLNFLFDDTLKATCFSIHEEIEDLKRRSEIPHCLLRLGQEILLEVPHVEAILGTPSRGSDILWLRGIFGDLASEVARNADLCDQLLALNRETKALDPSKSPPRYECIINGMIYDIEALPSGGGAKPCFKVSTWVGCRVSQTLMKLTYDFIPPVSTNQSAIEETNFDRDYFASDMLSVRCSEENELFHSVELQEWLYGIALNRYHQHRLDDVSYLIKEILKLVDNIHRHHRVMTDLTLANLWMEKSGKVVVADKKSLYQLKDEDDNPLVLGKMYPFIATVCYISTDEEALDFTMPLHYRPYQVANKSLATCMLRLIDQCNRTGYVSSLVSHSNVDEVFDRLLSCHMSVIQTASLLRMKAHVASLISPDSNRNTAKHVLEQMKAMDNRMLALDEEETQGSSPFHP